MKLILNLATILICTQLHANFQRSIWESSLTTAEPVIQKRAFIRTIDNIGKEFKELPLSFNEELQMFAGWLYPTADTAMARRWETAQVLIYRGMAHRREIDKDALALIVCHELGHLYGGKPLKPTGKYISAEGQADYFATRYCLKRALASIHPKNIEKRAIRAMHLVGSFLANNWGHPHPTLDTPDKTIVEKTLIDHPTPQCRLDTFWAGYHGGKRPNCWYKP